MAWSDLKAAIAAVIKTNGNNEITGAILQATLNTIVDTVGENASYKGYAITSTNPGTPDGVQFYLASEKGVYANFDALEITEYGLHVLVNSSGSWVADKVLDLESVYQDMHLTPNLQWWTTIGTLSESYDDVADELTVSWDQQLILIGGNNIYKFLPAGNVVLAGSLDFAYLDFNKNTNTHGDLTVGEWQGADSWKSPDKDTMRVIVFQRGITPSNKLTYSLLTNVETIRDMSSRLILAEDKITGIEQSIVDKKKNFTLQEVYVNDVLSTSANWRTVRIAVSEGDKVFYGVHSTTTAHLITFLDVSDNILSKVMSDTVGTEVLQQGFAIAPADTVEAVITTFNGYVDESYYATQYMDVANRILDLEAASGVGKTIVVDKTLTADPGNYIFNTIADAIAVAEGVDTIKLFGNEASPYEELALVLPDGLTIIGIGKPWIKGELPDDALTSEIDPTSTIDAFEGCTLENLIVTAKNMRYPIHADFSSGNTIKNIKNCKFIHYGNAGAWQYRTDNGWVSPDGPSDVIRGMSAWGGGTKAGDRVYIDGCYFESYLRAFSTHNNVDFELDYGASIVKVSNSEFVSHGLDYDASDLPFQVPFHLQSLDSNTDDIVILDNVLINGYLNNQVSGSGITHKLICNSPNLKQIWNLAGSAKSISDEWNKLNTDWFPIIKPEMTKLKNLHIGNLTKGTAVRLEGIGFEVYRNTDPISEFYGVLMEDTLVGKSGYIKHSGYIPWKYLDDPNYTIADGVDVSVDGSGNFVQDSSHVVAIATDNNNVFLG